MRLAAQAKGGYYPTPDRVVDMIADLIDTPYGYYHRHRNVLRILDPCCGAGDAVERLAGRINRASGTPVETYGVELHAGAGTRRRRGVLHRTLASDLFRTSIANGAFGLLYLNPPYDYDSRRRGGHGALLPHPLHPLPGRGGGAGVHRAKKQRLQVSARYLASHYGRMRCWSFPQPESGGLRPGGYSWDTGRLSRPTDAHRGGPR